MGFVFCVGDKLIFFLGGKFVVLSVLLFNVGYGKFIMREDKKFLGIFKEGFLF